MTRPRQIGLDALKGSAVQIILALARSANAFASTMKSRALTAEIANASDSVPVPLADQPPQPPSLVFNHLCRTWVSRGRRLRTSRISASGGLSADSDTGESASPASLQRNQREKSPTGSM